MDMSKFAVGQDLERRVEEVEHKQGADHIA